jgi:hypothetical protein
MGFKMEPVAREVSTLESYLAFDRTDTLRIIPVSMLNAETHWPLGINSKVRFIHDYHHWAHDLPDTIAGEKEVSTRTLNYYQNIGQAKAMIDDSVRALLLVDSYGQTLHVEHTGQQVPNQREFNAEVYAAWYNTTI